MSKADKIIPLKQAADGSGLGFADAGGVCAETEPFALMVKGNSMEPEFRDGHIIMVDPSVQPTDNRYVVAEVDDGYIFRQLRIIEDKKYLVPLNDLYPTLELKHEKSITGVVTQRSGRRRREARKYC